MALDNATVDRFLALVPADRADRTRNALHVLQDGESAGAIYNRELMDAKRTIDRSYEEAFNDTKRSGGTGQSSWEIHLELGSQSGIRSSIATSKKLIKTKLPYPEQIAAIRKLVTAALPIANLIEGLKKKVIKGKKPDPAVQARRAAVEANKLVMTCPCCFRSIAVLPSGLMADHGYTLPVHWGKTPSCPGRRFRPLEVSSDGVVFMIKKLSGDLKKINEELVEAPSKTSIYRPPRTRAGKGETITRDSPEWDRAYRQYVGNLESTRRMVEDQLAMFEQRLRQWKPTVTPEAAVGKPRKKSGAQLDRDINEFLGKPLLR